MKSNIFIATKNFEKSYTFILTKITVYSFEEFLYHIFHYPKSFYDFDSAIFKSFVRENIINIDDEIVTIVEKNSSPFDKMIDIVLKYSHLYNSNELTDFQSDILEYSRKEDIELLKEIGQDLLKNGEYFKAKELYKSIVDEYIDCSIFNNYSYACIKTGFIDEAKIYLNKACNIFQNEKVFYNYIKLLLQEKDIEKSLEVIELLTSPNVKSFKNFLTALVQVKQGEYSEALKLFEEAIEEEYTDQYMEHYIKLLMKTNKQSLALEKIEKYITFKDLKYYKFKALVYKSDGQIVEAIKSLEEGLKTSESIDNSIEVYTLISKFYRENYDFKKATQYIRMALRMKNSSKNYHLLYELALINKSNGNMNSYKDAMDKLIDIYKQNV